MYSLRYVPTVTAFSSRPASNAQQLKADYYYYLYGQDTHRMDTYIIIDLTVMSLLKKFLFTEDKQLSK